MLLIGFGTRLSLLAQALLFIALTVGLVMIDQSDVQLPHQEPLDLCSIRARDRAPLPDRRMRHPARLAMVRRTTRIERDASPWYRIGTTPT